MKITLEYPEFMLLSSTVLHLANHNIFAYILFGLSLLLGLCRLGLRIQKTQQESEYVDSSMGKIRDALLKLATVNTAPQDSGIRH